MSRSHSEKSYKIMKIIKVMLLHFVGKGCRIGLKIYFSGPSHQNWYPGKVSPGITEGTKDERTHTTPTSPVTACISTIPGEMKNTREILEIAINQIYARRSLISTGDIFHHHARSQLPSYSHWHVYNQRQAPKLLWCFGILP